MSRLHGNGGRVSQVLARRRFARAEIVVRRNIFANAGSERFAFQMGMLELSLTGRCIGGQAYFDSKNGPIGGAVGQIAYFPEESPFEARWLAGSETTLSCYFKGGSLDGSRPRPARELAAALSISSPTILNLMRWIERELRQPASYSEIILEGLTLQLAGLLGRLSRASGARAEKSASAAATGLDDLIGLINTGAGRPSLREAARGAGYSEGHFARLFRERTGRSFSDYLVERRLDRAKRMLEEDGRSIKAISYDLGYPSPAEFSRSFQRWMGLSPRQYRLQRQGPTDR